MAELSSHGERLENEPSKLVSLTGLSGKVAIYGGTFDPIHNGDLAVAQAAQEMHQFDAIIFVPTEHNPSKLHQPKASDEQRIAMLEVALKDVPYAYLATEQLTGKASNYTQELLQYISDRAGADLDLHFIMGADNLEDIPGWRNAESILSVAKCTPVNRPGYDVDTLIEKLRGKYADSDIDALSS
ncbi:MAG: adenylyltransferase/cytidyltransferase family protein, partial [Bdellovibrionales bacterium]|nr:adenylyltransferase/cytidyltransferase family protein [Bdellovibrionales bacterium]